jgi:hypothetical protein
MSKHMGQAEAESIIDGIKGGRIFGVTFVKKDGSVRRMTCRKGVRVGVKGTGAGWGAGALKPLRTVFDMNKAAFRTIPTDRVLEIRTSGVTHKSKAL